MSPEKYRWSSYNFYINTKSSELVDIKRVKSLLDMDISQYADFVQAAIDKPYDPFKNVYAGFLLGGKDFIKEQLNELAVYAAEKDFAHKRILLSQIDPDDIINAVSKHFKQTPKELRSNNKRPMTAKKMAIYLMRVKTGLTNNQIGNLFNMKSSAVSKAAIDFKQQMDNNKKLVKAVSEITSKVED